MNFILNKTWIHFILNKTWIHFILNLLSEYLGTIYFDCRILVLWILEYHFLRHTYNNGLSIGAKERLWDIFHIKINSVSFFTCMQDIFNMLMYGTCYK